MVILYGSDEHVRVGYNIGGVVSCHPWVFFLEKFLIIMVCTELVVIF